MIFEFLSRGCTRYILMKTYEVLNPILLKRQIDRITQELVKAYEKKIKEREIKAEQETGKSPKAFPSTQNDFVYNLSEATRQYNVPLVNVLRHRDVVSDISHTKNSTECPGKNFPYVQMLDALRDGEPFFDIGENYPYIKEAKFLKQLGIITGDGYGYFKPHEFITREEAMIIAYRVIKQLEKFKGTSL